MSQLPLDLEPQYALTVPHQEAKWHNLRGHDSSKVMIKDQEVGGGPIPGNPHPFSQNI